MSRSKLQLRVKAQRRFMNGHPWVFSNEVNEVPKTLMNGSVVELRDSRDKFLAYGFGNRNSLICFRLLSRNKSDGPSFDSGQFWKRQLAKAAELRKTLGLDKVSHRLCFGEADFIPGLIIDRYQIKNGFQTFVVQAQTAGADTLMASIVEILMGLCQSSDSEIPWDKTAVVSKNSSEMRTLEGIKPEEAKVLKAVDGLDLSNATILVESGLEFIVDLVRGQKTGFFLDQRENVATAKKLIQFKNQTVKILDLCCYVGQWSKNLATHLESLGCKVELVCADASQKALDSCLKNLESLANTKVTAMKADVMQDLSSLASATFDIVVCDPPALIKSRKHRQAGERAYEKLNHQALRLVRSGGWLISCSCSGLMEEQKFLEVIASVANAHRIHLRVLARGSQASDHPQLAEFPEGSYLKAFIAKSST